MGFRAPSTPRQGTARPVVVASFYAALVVVGFFWHAVGQGDNNVWANEAGRGGWRILGTPLLGIALGLFIVQLFRALELHMAWLSELHHEFRAIFGRPHDDELVLLAAASALGEEIFFRGAMLDAWGLGWSSAVFALLHIPPRRNLWPWTASSLALGLLLGWITVETGNLGAAVAAHFVINLQNLRYITRHRPRMAVRGPIRPETPPPPPTAAPEARARPSRWR